MAYDLNLCAPKGKKEPADLARWERELSEDETVARLCEITRLSSRLRSEEDDDDEAFVFIGLPRSKKGVEAAYSALVRFAVQRHLKLFDPQIGDYIPLENPGLLPPMMISAPKVDPPLPDSRPGPVKLFLGGLFLSSLV